VNSQFDVVVIGSGLAGLAVALSVAEARRVAVICKRGAADGATDRAQGGIAAVFAAEDHFDRHVADTLTAGAGLCDAAITRSIVEEAPTSIEWLVAQGVAFTRDDASYHLTLEGGHSCRRIVHADDATGHEMHRVLARRAHALPNITLLEDHVAIELITCTAGGGNGSRCIGLYVLDVARSRVVTMAAAQTVIATGGAAGLYRHTTNPAGATGDGIAMAWRAGCSVANLEFIQFHPTSLHHPGADPFLISEAVRGEGGVLRLPPEAGKAAGLRFMPFHDPRAELAPRDVVARAIDHEMRTRNIACVHLDITGQPAEVVKRHFPTIHARCLALGIDMTHAAIPVAPAAHFTCGGIVVGRAGRTEVEGLYAVGEVACTGLHGANRLASNSLLECVAIGRAAGKDIVRQPQFVAQLPPPWPDRRVSATFEPAATTRCWRSLRQAMWSDVGIVRTTEGLHRARTRILELRHEALALAAGSAITRELIELGNGLEVASLIVESALSRHESRGAHHNGDHPPAKAPGRSTVLVPEVLDGSFPYRHGSSPPPSLFDFQAPRTCP